MAVRRLTILLDERACILALGPYHPGYLLRPESRAAIERGSRLRRTVREATCLTDEACDMLDYFRTAADALRTIGDPEGPFCVRARDNLQHALRVARITCGAIEK